MSTETDIWSSDGETVVEVRDLFGKLVKRGDVLIECTGGGCTGGAKEWQHYWDVFEMPKLLNGSGYSYTADSEGNRKRYRFWYATPSRSLLVEDPKFCAWFRERTVDTRFMRNHLKEGTVEEVLAAFERKPWE